MSGTGDTRRGQGGRRYEVLSQVGTWDDVTKGVVLARLGRQQPAAFFPPAHQRGAAALLARLVAMDTEPERRGGEAERIPLLELVDDRLLHDETDGFRYEDMPPDREVWARTVPALDADADARFGQSFADCSPKEQDECIESVRTSQQDWHSMPAGRVFDLWLRYACTAFYSHPAAWDEIGFGGPAYPRGYKALGTGKREPWER